MKGLLPSVLLGAYFHILLWSTTSAFHSNFVDKLGYAVGLRRYVYSVVIHAGSTGTRLYCYGFYTSRDYKTIKLNKVWDWTYVPPIHDFASNPSQAIDGISRMVENAKRVIPKTEWHQTSLILMATAGVLNLPRTQSEILLSILRQYLRTTELRTSYDCVTLLDGDDEGLLEWFTVNLLLERLNARNPHTVAVLDMGGMSTTLGFVPVGNNALTPEQFKHLTGLRAYYHKFEVYSQGYSHYGLNEFRIKVLLAGQRNGSECISPLIDTEWIYNGRKYNIRGLRRSQQVGVYNPNLARGPTQFTSPVIDFMRCEKSIKDMVQNMVKPPSLKNSELYLTSAFFYRLAEAGVISYSRGGPTTLSSIIRIAKQKCQETRKDEPFLCMDIIYIFVLLRDVLGFSQGDTIFVYEELYGKKINMGLGAAFLNIQTRILPHEKYNNTIPDDW